MPSSFVPPSLDRMALSAALQHAQNHPVTLPALPPEISPSRLGRPADVARWASEGFDVAPLVRQHAGTETSLGERVWAQAFVASLAVRWMACRTTVPQEALADRWTSATRPLSDATRMAGLSRLGEGCRTVEALRNEQAELQAVFAASPTPRVEPHRPRY